MNAHFKVSLIKSFLRMGGCVAAMCLCGQVAIAILVLSGSLLGAELLGILEEIMDKRK